MLGTKKLGGVLSREIIDHLDAYHTKPLTRFQSAVVASSVDEEATRETLELVQYVFQFRMYLLTFRQA